MVPGCHVGARARGRYLSDVTSRVIVRTRSPRPTTRDQEMLLHRNEILVALYFYSNVVQLHIS